MYFIFKVRIDLSLNVKNITPANIRNKIFQFDNQAIFDIVKKLVSHSNL